MGIMKSEWTLFQKALKVYNDARSLAQVAHTTFIEWTFMKFLPVGLWYASLITPSFGGWGPFVFLFRRTKPHYNVYLNYVFP